MIKTSNTIEIPAPLTDAELDAICEELDRICQEILKERATQ